MSQDPGILGEYRHKSEFIRLCIENQSIAHDAVLELSQFEMLKLHYLNLMKEMQETALMLNLYEQHQLLIRQREREGKDGKLHSIACKQEHIAFKKRGPSECVQATKRQKV